MGSPAIEQSINVASQRSAACGGQPLRPGFFWGARSTSRAVRTESSKTAWSTPVLARTLTPCRVFTRKRARALGPFVGENLAPRAPAHQCPLKERRFGAADVARVLSATSLSY